MIPVELDTAPLATHSNILLVSGANAEECPAFCIWEIFDHDRCMPTGENLSPKGIKSVIYLRGMFKSVMLGIGKGCSWVVMPQLRLQGSNAWQFIQCARDIGTT